MAKASTPETNLEKSTEFGTDETQKKVDQAEAQGFYGVKVDPIPDEEYSLMTGPVSPSTVTNATERATQHGLGADNEGAK